MPADESIGADEFYDDGYQRTETQPTGVWGQKASGLVRYVTTHLDLEGKRVLDVGCGDRLRNSLAFEEAGAHVVAVDKSPTAIARASQLARGRDINLVRADIVPRWQEDWKASSKQMWTSEGLIPADATQLPFGRGQDDRHAFDVIVLQGVLLCFETDAQVAAFLAYMSDHLLRPDGLVIVSTFNSRRQELEVAHRGVVHWVPTSQKLLQLLSPLHMLTGSHEDRDYTKGLHPPNYEEHSHSIDRLLCHRAPAYGEQFIWDRREWRYFINDLREMEGQRMRAIADRDPLLCDKRSITYADLGKQVVLEPLGL